MGGRDMKTEPVPRPKVRPCKECARLKLKCSRDPWPCGHCKAKGVAHLCPEGSQSSRPYKKRKSKHVADSSAGEDAADDELGSIREESASSLMDLGRARSTSVLTPEGSGSNHVNARPDTQRIHALAEQAVSHRAVSPLDHPTGSWSTSNGSGNAGMERPALGKRLSSTKQSHAFYAPNSTSLHRLQSSGSALPTTTSPGRDSATSGSRTSEHHGGLLLRHRDGNSTYYGPHSHSFHLAQMPSIRRGVNHTSDFSPNHPPRSDTHVGIPRPDAETFDGHAGSSRGVRSASNLRQSEKSTQSLEVGSKIMMDPMSFIAVPGFPLPFDHGWLASQLRGSLPAAIEARRAFRNYELNVAWLYNPLTSLDPLWQEFYPAPPAQSTSKNLSRLAVLFAVLSLGFLYDLQDYSGRQNRARESEAAVQGSLEKADYFHQRAWAALQYSRSASHHSLEQVQTINLIGHYLVNRHEGRSADAFFLLIGSASRSAIALGLHREDPGWRLSAQELEARRKAFWETYSLDCFRSLAYGRPCTIRDAHVDCDFPTILKEGETEPGLTHTFHVIKYQTVRLLNQVLDVGQRSDLSYSTVLDLDRSFRQLWASMPANFRNMPMTRRCDLSQDLDPVSTLPNVLDDDLLRKGSETELHLFLQGNTAVANINQSLLHLHRPWFVRALREDPDSETKLNLPTSTDVSSAGSSGKGSGSRDALDSPYARSILAVSESSKSLIDVAAAVFDIAPSIGVAWNYFWQHCFNAAICQCLFVLYNPSSISAMSAWNDARRAVRILRQARPTQSDAVWAGKLDLLEALQEQAGDAMRSSSGPGATSASRSDQASAAAREGHLSLIGTTSNVDRRLGNSRRPTLALQSRGSDESLPGAEQPLAAEGAVGETSSFVDQPEGLSEDRFYNLSNWLAGNLLEKSSRMRSRPQSPGATFPDMQSHDAPFASSPSGPNIGFDHPSTSFSGMSVPVMNDSGSPSVGMNQSRQLGSVPWGHLLSELLEGGCEPDSNFWQAISGGTSFEGVS